MTVAGGRTGGAMLRDAGGVPLARGARMRTGCVYRFAGALATPDALAKLDLVGALWAAAANSPLGSTASRVSSQQYLDARLERIEPV